MKRVDHPHNAILLEHGPFRALGKRQRHVASYILGIHMLEIRKYYGRGRFTFRRQWSFLSPVTDGGPAALGLERPSSEQVSRNWVALTDRRPKHSGIAPFRSRYLVVGARSKAHGRTAPVGFCAVRKADNLL